MTSPPIPITIPSNTNITSSSSTPSSDSSSSSSPSSVIILFIGICLIFGTLIRHFAHVYRISLPYSIILLVVGMVIGISQLGDPSSSTDSFVYSTYLISNMNPNLILYIFLPTLIFDSAFNIKWKDMSSVLFQSIWYAFAGVIISMLGISLFAYYFVDYQWDFVTSLLFSSILSATDPLAVTTIMSQLGAPKKLSTLIDGESLLNDGSAFLLYLLFYDIILTGNTSATGDSIPIPTSLSVTAEILKFIRLTLGGPSFGFLFAWCVVKWLNRVFNDVEVEITTTVACAYINFYVSQSLLEVSGVLSMVSFALYLSKHRDCVSPDVQESLKSVWKILSYCANTLIFIISGVISCEKIFINKNIRAVDFGYAILLYIWIHFVRGFTVVLFAYLMKAVGSMTGTKHHYDMEWREGIILTMAGLRGAMSLSLGLLTSLETKIESLIRDRIIFLISAIVFLTLVINGTSAKYLVEFLQLTEATQESQRVFQQAKDLLEYKTKKFLLEKKNEKGFQNVNWERIDGMPLMRDEGEGERAQRNMYGDIERRRDNLHEHSPHSQSFSSFSLFHLPINSRNIQSPPPLSPSSSPPVVPLNHRLNLRAELSNRFLLSLHTEYESQYAKGLITREALKILIDAVESGEEKKDIETHWKLIFDAVNFPSMYRALYESQFPIHFSFVDSFLTSLMFSRISLSIAILTSVVSASFRLDDLLESFPQIDNVDSLIVNELKKENNAFHQQSISYWNNMKLYYPSAFHSVVTRQLTMQVLFFERDTVDSLHGRGMLEENEYQSLRDVIQEKIYRLERKSIRGKFDSVNEIIMKMKFFRLLTESKQQFILENGRRKLFGVSNTIIQEGEKIGGIFIIIRGAIEIKMKKIEGEENDEGDDNGNGKDGITNPSSFSIPSNPRANILSLFQFDESDIPTTSSISTMLTPGNINIINESKLDSEMDEQSIELKIHGNPLENDEHYDATNGTINLHHDSTTNHSLAPPSSYHPQAVAFDVTPPLCGPLHSSSQSDSSSSSFSSYGAGSVVGLYSCGSSLPSMECAVTLTPVEAFFLPLPIVESLLRPPSFHDQNTNTVPVSRSESSHSLLWRMAATSVLRSRFLPTLESRGILFHHVHALMEKAKLHYHCQQQNHRSDMKNNEKENEYESDLRKENKERNIPFPLSLQGHLDQSQDCFHHCDIDTYKGWIYESNSIILLLKGTVFTEDVEEKETINNNHIIDNSESDGRKGEENEEMEENEEEVKSNSSYVFSSSENNNNNNNNNNKSNNKNNNNNNNILKKFDPNISNVQAMVCPSLLGDFHCRVRCGFVSGAVWMSWTTQDEEEVKNKFFEKKKRDK